MHGAQRSHSQKMEIYPSPQHGLNSKHKFQSASDGGEGQTGPQVVESWSGIPCRGVEVGDMRETNRGRIGPGI